MSDYDYDALATYGVELQRWPVGGLALYLIGLYLILSTMYL
jgi:hypothetical protein